MKRRTWYSLLTLLAILFCGPWGGRAVAGELPSGVTLVFLATPKTFKYTGGAGTLSFVLGGVPGTQVVVASGADDAWITVDPAYDSRAYTIGPKGTAKGKVLYRLQRYEASAPSPRQGKMRIGGAQFTVFQTGAPCTVTINPIKGSVGGAGGQGEITVSAPAGCDWTAAVDGKTPWITIEGDSAGEGNGVVSYRATPNATGKNRTGKVNVVTVATKPQKKTHSVAQSWGESQEIVALPTFNPPAGTYSAAPIVTLRSATSGATIRYTTNGATPSQAIGVEIASGGTVTVSATQTLKAVAYKEGFKDSAVASAAYVIKVPPKSISLTRHNGVTEAPSKVTLLFQAQNKTTGLPADNLTDADFAVTEGSDPVTHSEHFREVLKRDALPYTLYTVLVVDVSASIRPDDLDQMKAAARQMVAAHEPGSGAVARDPTTGKAVSNLVAQQVVRIYVFDDGMREVTSGWSADPDVLLAAIDRIQRGGPSTNLYGALVTGLGQWADSFTSTQVSQGFLVAITDGKDTAGVKTLADAISARGTKRVYTFGVGSEVEPDKLTQLASPGAYYPLGSYAEVQGALEKVQTEMDLFANSFYYFYYASPKRSGYPTVTLSVVGNTNTGSDASVSYQFNANGFSSVLPEVTVKGPTTVAVGESVEWVAKTWWGYNPENFSWTTSNPGAVTVSVNPLTSTRATITGVAAGKADIMVTDTANTHYSSTDPKFGQNVSKLVATTTRGLALSGEAHLVAMGETVTLTAQTIGGSLSPSYTWTVSDGTIGTLSATTGASVKVTGASAGQTIVTVRDTATQLTASWSLAVWTLKLATNGQLLTPSDRATWTATVAGVPNAPLFAWSVSDPTVVSLSATTGAAVTLTRLRDGPCTVTVEDRANPPATVSLPVVRRLVDSLAGMEFLFVPPGMFAMGDTFDSGWSDELPVRMVTLTRGFYLGETEVTQGQWRAIMGMNPSDFSLCGDTCPVENVSWADAQAFIAELNRRAGARAYRLPTEAEWEYAASFGSEQDPAPKQKYAGTSDDAAVGDYAWYYHNSGYQTHPVKEKLPNVLGIYDLTGNVSEWVQDWYGNYPVGAATDPEGPSGSYWASRGIRGGSWDEDARRVRAAGREYSLPGYHFDGRGVVGFRLVRAP